MRHSVFCFINRCRRKRDDNRTKNRQSVPPRSHFREFFCRREWIMMRQKVEQTWPRICATVNNKGTSSKSLFYFLDDLNIFLLGKVCPAGIHLKYATPLKLSFILGNQVKMEMATTISISPVIHFAGMKCLMNCLGSPGHIGETGVPIFLTDVNQFADMILIGDNSAPGMALFFEAVMFNICWCEKIESFVRHCHQHCLSACSSTPVPSS